MGKLVAKLVVVALTVVTVLGVSEGRTQHGPTVRSRQLLDNNTATTSDEGGGLDTWCEIGTDDPSVAANAERANYDFEFWYAIGTTTSSMDALKLFKVEQLLYTSIKQSALWCTKITNAVAGIGNRRRDVQQVQRLGVVTYTPGNKDTPTECK